MSASGYQMLTPSQKRLYETFLQWMDRVRHPPMRRRKELRWRKRWNKNKRALRHLFDPDLTRAHWPDVLLIARDQWQDRKQYPEFRAGRRRSPSP